jgi:hypothetical protein
MGGTADCTGHRQREAKLAAMSSLLANIAPTLMVEGVSVIDDHLLTGRNGAHSWQRIAVLAGLLRVRGGDSRSRGTASVC